MAQPLNGKADLTSAESRDSLTGPAHFCPRLPLLSPQSLRPATLPLPSLACARSCSAPASPPPGGQGHGQPQDATLGLCPGPLPVWLAGSVMSSLKVCGKGVSACVRACGDPLVPGAPRNPEPPRSPHPARQNPISSRLLSPAARREGPASRGCGVRLS